MVENRSDYIRSWEDVDFLPGSLEALADIRDSPYLIVIVTNQSAVGRGYITLERARAISDRILARIVAAGGRVDAIYMCPHAPDAGCSCRKPRPGLILQAARDLDIDLGRSILIGDALTDLQAGRAAQVPTTVLLRSGRGADQIRLPQAQALKPFPVFDDLAQALAAFDL